MPNYYRPEDDRPRMSNWELIVLAVVIIGMLYALGQTAQLYHERSAIFSKSAPHEP